MATTQKNLPRIRAAAVLERAGSSPELRSEWANMLAHQLPQLPPVDAMLEDLRGLVGWITDGAVTHAIPVLSAPRMGDGETLIAAGPFVHGISGSHLEHIRFAGANRLVLRFSYDGSSGPTRRAVEPYSLRVSSRGSTLLYAWEIASRQIKAFDVGKMSQVEVTRDAFHPRYRIEFTADGPIHATPAAARSSGIRYARPARNRSGPVYAFTCPVCQKEFRHRRNDAQLRRHKVKDGDWYCGGRRGSFARTEY
ncbi:MAG: WYL domain-containing protein [Gemmatimonadaceae bacterium]